MRATVRARLTIGFLVLAAIGSLVSVAILATLSRSLDELRRVVTVSDVIEHKALEMRFDVLAMSDARRGFLISSADEAQRVRKEQAYEHFEVVVAEIRTLARQGQILGLLAAADLDARTLNRLEDGILATMASGDVEGATARYIEHSPSDDTTTVMLRFESGATGLIFCSVATATDFNFTLYGSRGLAEISKPNLQTLRFVPVSEHAPTGPVTAPPDEISEHTGFDMLAAELGEFARAIREKRPYPVAIDEVLHGMSVFDAIVRSAKSGNIESVTEPSKRR